MSSLTIFVISAWLVALGGGGLALQQAWQAHANLDCGHAREAQVAVLRAIGASLFLATCCGLMFGIRFLVTPIVLPAVIGCVILAMAIVLLWQARARFHNECPPSHP